MASSDPQRPAVQGDTDTVQLYLLMKMGRVKSTTSVLIGVIVVAVTATSASRLATTPISPVHVPSADKDPDELFSRSRYSVLQSNGKH
jgi:hypothetical protein